jgi:RimJ/RimL family protein N-acetyltransferase
MLYPPLRPAEPERDFRQIAAWFSSFEEQPTTPGELHELYGKYRAHLRVMVAEDELGTSAGFSWLRFQPPSTASLSLFVTPELRRQGIGTRLFEDQERSVRRDGAKTMSAFIPDTDLGSRVFFEQRGFREKRHIINMRLDLDAFDDRPYQVLIDDLQKAGFRFTSMEELGDGENARRKLYALNESTDRDVPGTKGERSWDSFEDFQDSVCRSDWYKPGGQMVVIEHATGIWVAMSAITQFYGYAYNLHSGVDRRYRGRKLAQAVKVCALRYARQVLKVTEVRTQHNTFNLPMLAIDRKLGYVEHPGTFLMVKLLQ